MTNPTTHRMLDEVQGNNIINILGLYTQQTDKKSKENVLLNDNIHIDKTGKTLN